ncbi:MAG: peptidoglycan DD-metalloendopeptidase family protein [Clostridia bacterium]|nr:peptidoglycan DD-metalloendopeptidase family protein [Clostridia bacterium]
MKSQMKNRVLAVLLCVCMFAAALVVAPGNPVQARTAAEVEADIAELEAQQAVLQEQLDKLREDEAEQEAYYYTLCDQIDTVEAQIDTCIANIRVLDSNIRGLDAELREAEMEIAHTMFLLKQRVKALYKSGSESTLVILLSSDSWTEYAEKAELMKAVTEHDRQLIEEVSVFMEATSDTRDELDKERKAASALRTTLEEKQEELLGLESEAAAVLAKIREERGELEDDHAHNEDDLYDLGAELEELLQGDTWEDVEDDDTTIGDVGGGSVDFGGTLGWPCPGYAYISSYWGDGRGHKGLDLAAVRGTPILAAESGTVVRAWTADDWGYGWGYHVLIKHDNTYSTLYAHACELAVYEGQYVERGQLIAYVGNTGNSFGNHLHFEVYKNGVRVDPAPYLGLY